MVDNISNTYESDHGTNCSTTSTSILKLVIQNDHQKLSEVLRSASKVDMNKLDVDGMSPLMVSCCFGNFACAETLVENGADVNLTDDIGINALMYASNGYSQCLEILLHTSADINLVDSNGWTALHIAIDSGSESCVKLLLEKGVKNVNAKDQIGMTPFLHACSQNGNIHCLKCLVDHGADIDECDNDGFTSLMWACLRGHMNAVKFLLDNGADKTKVNKYSETAYDLISQSNYKSILELLEFDKYCYILK
jgi:ankyrin repeat protein